MRMVGFRDSYSIVEADLPPRIFFRKASVRAFRVVYVVHVNKYLRKFKGKRNLGVRRQVSALEFLVRCCLAQSLRPFPKPRTKLQNLKAGVPPALQIKTEDKRFAASNQSNHRPGLDHRRSKQPLVRARRRFEAHRKPLQFDCRATPMR